jgi:hypothetical protein
MAILDGLIKPVSDLIGKVIDRVIPDPVAAAEMKYKVAVLEQNGELAELTAETSLAQGQIDVNKIEAANSNTFVSGWRPFIGWVCGASLAYAAIIEPVSRFLAQVVFHYIGAFPVVDTTITLQVLLGLLGLGGLRTYEKVKGTK